MNSKAITSTQDSQTMSADQSLDLKRQGVLFVCATPLVDSFQSGHIQLLSELFAKSSKTVLSPDISRITFFRKLIRQIPRTKLVHIIIGSPQTPIVNIILIILLSRFFGKQVVADFRHSLIGIQLESMGQIGRRMLRFCDSILTVLSHTADLFRGYRLAAKPLPSAVNLKGITARQIEQLQPRILAFFPANRFYNPERVTKAFTLIKSKYPRTEMKCVITDTQGKENDADDSTYKTHNIEMTKQTNLPNIRETLEWADIVVAPSSTGDSNEAILMALTAGRPVINCAATVPFGLPSDESAGLITISPEPATLADLIVDLIENPDLVYKLSKKAPLSAGQFAWTHTQRVWREHYRSLLRH